MSYRPQFRLVADYHCHPTWRRTDDDGHENVAPRSLALPPQLAAELVCWAEVFDRTLDSADPMSSGFSTTIEHELFVRWGYSLGRAMADSLRCEVEYFDDLAREAVTLRDWES